MARAAGHHKLWPYPIYAPLKTTNAHANRVEQLHLLQVRVPHFRFGARLLQKFWVVLMMRKVQPDVLLSQEVKEGLLLDFVVQLAPEIVFCFSLLFSYGFYNLREA